MDSIRLIHPNTVVPASVVRARKRLGEHLSKPVTSIALRKWALRPRRKAPPSSWMLSNHSSGSLQLANEVEVLSLDGCRFGRITGSNLLDLTLHNSEVAETLSRKNCPMLHSLQLTGQSKVTGLENMSNLNRLTILGATGLPMIKSLRVIHLSCGEKVQLQALCHCTVLTKATLHIKGTVQLDHVRLFATQPKLESLFLRGEFSSEAFAGLSELDQGKEMRISHLAICDTGKALKPAPIDMRLDKLVLFTGTWGQSWVDALVKSEKLRGSLYSIVLQITEGNCFALLTFKKLLLIEHTDDKLEALKPFLSPPVE